MPSFANLTRLHYIAVALERDRAADVILREPGIGRDQCADVERAGGRAAREPQAVRGAVTVRDHGRVTVEHE